MKNYHDLNIYRNTKFKSVYRILNYVVDDSEKIKERKKMSEV